MCCRKFDIFLTIRYCWTMALPMNSYIGKMDGNLWAALLSAGNQWLLIIYRRMHCYCSDLRSRKGEYLIVRLFAGMMNFGGIDKLVKVMYTIGHVKW